MTQREGALHHLTYRPHFHKGLDTHNPLTNLLSVVSSFISLLFRLYDRLRHHFEVILV